MEPARFEHFAVHQGRLHVSVCRTCLCFIAAAPDPMRLVMREARHVCERAPKKPSARALLYATDSTPRKIADALSGSD